MTLSTRNRLFVVAFVAAVLPATLLVAMAKETILAAPAVSAAASNRAQGLIQAVTTIFLKPSPYAPLATFILSVLIAGVSLALIYYFFEKTQSPEILFFALFALSLIGESFRIAVPLAFEREWPPAYVVGAARALVFSRFFGLFSLFATGVYATGAEFQKHGRVIIIIAAAALAIAAGIPIDGLVWDSAFTPIPGYESMLKMVEHGVALITVVSFFVAAYSRGSADFIHVGVGCFLVIVGRDGLMRADTWLAVPLGFAAFVSGAWLIAAKIHRFYLWL